MLAEGALVQPVPEDSEREDGEGEEVAAVARVAAKEVGEQAVVVFLSGDDAVWGEEGWLAGLPDGGGGCGGEDRSMDLLPEGWVEGDGGNSDWREEMLVY